MLKTKQLKLGNTGLKLTCSRSQLEDYCGAKARETYRAIADTVDAVGKLKAPEIIRSIVNRSGVDFPLKELQDKDRLMVALARTVDEKWWRKKLSRMQRRDLENFIRGLGGVSKRREIYVSDYSLQCRLEQKRSNKHLMERLEAENEEGQVYTLAELAELSPSNPLIRRAELMTRLRGFEDFAENSEESYQAICYTIACPSKYHATHQSGKKNCKYNGSTVGEAQDYLNSVWQCARAALDRKGIKGFGMRVAEPQQDGTPHWHVLLFLPVDQAAETTRILRHYALLEDGDEPGADKYRFDALYIDTNKGSATGYLAKYISKNIDGYNLEHDSYGKSAISSAMRVEAWASIHGIRQFQQIGGASVTIWRELRRLNAEQVDKGLLEQLVTAADNGDWGLYNELMGGVNCLRKDRPVRPMMIRRENKNAYGEAVAAIKGILLKGKAIVTRIHNWTVKAVSEASERPATAEDGIGYGAALSTAPPGACAHLEFCQ